VECVERRSRDRKLVVHLRHTRKDALSLKVPTVRLTVELLSTTVDELEKKRQGLGARHRGGYEAGTTVVLATPRNDACMFAVLDFWEYSEPQMMLPSTAGVNTVPDQVELRLSSELLKGA
jgi:hypothetical protein